MRDYLRPLKSQAGNTLLVLVMVVTSTFTITFFLYNMMRQLNSQNRDNTRQQIYESTMTSLLNYTRSGIKRRWCFTDTWEKYNESLCNLAHPGSSERMLIVSAQQVSHIQDLIAVDPTFPHASPLDLPVFEKTLDVPSLPETHPLKQVLSAHEFDFLGKVKLKIESLNAYSNFGSPQTKELPISGAEAYIRITVEMFPQTGKKLPEGRKEMRAWSNVIVFPREVGTFALIVPGSLDLTGGNPAPDSGDISFKTLPSKINVPGIVFESPVFVNNDVNVPTATTKEYTPVLFSSQVIIGDGQLLRGGSPATTNQAGGFQNQTYASMNGFAGFAAGINIDGQTDRGLDCWIKGNCTKADMKLMNRCIARDTMKIDVEDKDSVSKNAALLVRRSSQPGAQWDFSWSSMSEGDFFQPQPAVQTNNNGPASAFTSPPSRPTLAATEVGSTIMSVDVETSGTGFSYDVMDVRMPRAGQLKVFPKLPGAGAPTPTIIVQTLKFPGVDDRYPTNIESFNVSVTGTTPTTNFNFDVTVRAFDVGWFYDKHPGDDGVFKSLRKVTPPPNRSMVKFNYKRSIDPPNNFRG